MRVLHVIQSLHPRFGGPPAVALRLASAQAASGARVGLISYESSDADGAMARSLSSIPGLACVDRIALPIEYFRLGRMLASEASSWITRESKNWDIAHIHNIWDPIVRSAAAAAGRFGLPYVVTPHGCLDPWAMRQTWLKRLKKRCALALRMRHLLEHASFLHVLNQEEERGLSELGLCVPTEIVPNGIDLSEMGALPPRGSFRALVPAIGQKPFVLFLSRLQQKKGLDVLIDAFSLIASRFPLVDLVVVGPDEGVLQSSLRQVSDAGLADRVHFVGPVYGASKYAALVDADVFCLPSRSEGFSIAILEALACRCPVVISEHCNFPDVGDHGAGHVVPLRVQSVADALADFLESAERRGTAGSRGASLVRERFTWPTIASRLLDLYRASHQRTRENVERPIGNGTR